MSNFYVIDKVGLKRLQKEGGEGWLVIIIECFTIKYCSGSGQPEAVGEGVGEHIMAD